MLGKRKNQVTSFVIANSCLSKQNEVLYPATKKMPIRHLQNEADPQKYYRFLVYITEEHMAPHYGAPKPFRLSTLLSPLLAMYTLLETRSAKVPLRFTSLSRRGGLADYKAQRMPASPFKTQQQQRNQKYQIPRIPSSILYKKT